MRELVTDTHALLWHLYSPRRLGKSAREVFVQADSGEARIHIPALVIAEALMVAQKGRIPEVGIERLIPHLDAARYSENYVFSDLRAAMVLESHWLIAIPDIFDRLIVAEALARGLPLLTRDPVIQASGLVATIWD